MQLMVVMSKMGKRSSRRPYEKGRSSSAAHLIHLHSSIYVDLRVFDDGNRLESKAAQTGMAIWSSY